MTHARTNVVIPLIANEFSQNIDTTEGCMHIAACRISLLLLFNVVLKRIMDDNLQHWDYRYPVA